MERLVEVDGDLLEAPVWDDRDDTLLFVDMRRPAWHRLPWGGSVGTFGHGAAASAVLPSTRHQVIVAERDRIRLGSGGDSAAAGDLRLPDPEIRFNDGACDVRGRLWIGTMADDARPGAGRLYCLDTDLSWTVILEDVTISNGIAWSPDDRSMYYTDSATRRVDVFDFDEEEGSAADRRPLIDTSTFDGIPDGITVDAEGCLWVAFYGGSAVRRFGPDGTLLAEHATPVPRPTSLCFAGPALDTLVVTVRGDAVGADGRPCGAHLYALDPGVRGLTTPPFGG